MGPISRRPFLLAAVCLALAGLAAGCPSRGEPLGFPPGFLFGTSVAGFQADMGCPTLGAACDDPGSDWYVFITDPTLLASSRTFLSGDPPSDGPGMWELYEEDFDRARNELGNDALRLSIEWSRIFPTATDGVEGYDALRAIADDAAITHYHDMFQALRARGLEPLVTLNHYTLPLWIHDVVGCHENINTCSPRGWVDSARTVAEITKYAGFCAREFGAEVDLWATLNEPFAVLFPGFIYPSADRSNPPALLLAADPAKIVLEGLVYAHAGMYGAVKAEDTADADGDGAASEVGVVYAMAPVAPADPENPLDVEAAENVFYLWNMVYLNAVINGDFDAQLDGNTVHDPALEGKMDYLGINYYTRITVTGTPGAVLPQLSPLTNFDILSLQPWEDYPRGLYEMLLVADGLGVPSIVTESGAQDPDDDGQSASWLVRYLAWTSRAIRDGADVRGFFYWTLMDNYEWNHGMDIRMGLYAVSEDDPAKVRVARSGVEAYARITAEREVPEELLELYPAPEEPGP